MCVCVCVLGVKRDSVLNKQMLLSCIFLAMIKDKSPLLHSGFISGTNACALNIEWVSAASLLPPKCIPMSVCVCVYVCVCVCLSVCEYAFM